MNLGLIRTLLKWSKIGKFALILSLFCLIVFVQLFCNTCQFCHIHYVISHLSHFVRLTYFVTILYVLYHLTCLVKFQVLSHLLLLHLSHFIIVVKSFILITFLTIVTFCHTSVTLFMFSHTCHILSHI